MSTATLQLQYSEADLMADHEYSAPHMVLGERLHGGFLADGTYQPPRALVREPAMDAWEQELIARGGSVFDADASLLDGLRMPTLDQARVLLRNDLPETFWNGLTIIGKIEAKGRLLAEIEFPDLADHVVEDISGMAIGHLNKGLLLAHGLDEGGQPDMGIGGHDAMWFAARDLVIDPGTFPDVEPPENIGRPDAGTRFIPEIPAEVEGLVSFLANLLIIEFRAELGFADTQAILRTPDLFTDRREAAEEAAEIVERIRIDEAIHVRSLCLYLGEIRSVHFATIDGGQISGAEMFDRFWGGLVRWATVDQPKLAAPESRRMISERIARHTEADRVLEEFDAAGE